jgi:hypothetical protein
MIERRLRAQLDGPGGAALIVAEAGTVEPCAVAVAGVALSLASEGRRVVMADVARDRPLAALFGVTSREKELHNVTLGSESAFLIIGPDDPAEMDQDWMPNGADALLVLASVDPAFGAEHLAGWAGKAVVVVDPRQTTATRVQAIGALLRQARIAVRSAIVIGADPEGDDTLGSTPDHLGAVEQHAPGVLASSGR